MVCTFVLRDNVCRLELKQDHDNAAALANGLGALRGISAERSPGDTNAVYFQVGCRCRRYRSVVQRRYHMTRNVVPLAATRLCCGGDVAQQRPYASGLFRLPESCFIFGFACFTLWLIDDTPIPMTPAATGDWHGCAGVRGRPRAGSWSLDGLGVLRGKHDTGHDASRRKQGGHRTRGRGFASGAFGGPSQLKILRPRRRRCVHLSVFQISSDDESRVFRRDWGGVYHLRRREGVGARRREAARQIPSFT